MIYVTGSKGYLGKNLCLNLNLKGINYKELIHRNINLEDENSVMSAVPKNSTIIHLAASLPRNYKEYNLEKFNKINLLMVKNLLKTNPEKIIFASSMTVYSNGGLNLKEDQVSRKLSGYPNYKRQSEKIIEKSGIKNTILRFPGLFGGDRKTGIIYNSAYSLLKNQNLSLPSSPIIWAALNIEDAADLVSRAINSEPLGVINAGTDDVFSTSILIQKLALVIKKEIKYQLPFAPEFSMNIDKLRDSIGLPNKSFNQRLEELVINIKKVI